ncbi:MAG TPA: ATP-binding protein [Thermoanaerobaculia bacterium]|nr:ATP-binding protein [Thermoanaerobaculia bacterium]
MRLTPPRLFARISLRLMLFNLLLVFLPVAGLLLLGEYEWVLESTQAAAMSSEASLVVSVLLSGGDPDLARAAALVKNIESANRIRVVDVQGRVVADSGPVYETGDQPDASEPQHNWLYRVGVAVLKRPWQWLTAPPRTLPTSDEYERSPVLRGQEVLDALRGVNGFEKRVESGDDRSITLYVSRPIYRRGETIGAVVVSRTTDTIRIFIHSFRLRIFQIFLASVVVAMFLTLMVSTTIVQPIRQLRNATHDILDHSGRLRGRFKGSKKRDEIGDLSRALERLSRRLEERQIAAESFASDVSHEFKNPLASIRAAVEMLAQSPSAEDRARFVRVAESEIARMERLLSQVRDLTTIERALAAEPREPFDLRDLLGEIVDGFRLRERGRIAIDVDLPAEPVTVTASRDRLKQVFDNLLDNAVSFSNHVAVHVSATGVVRVVDDGPGIPPENVSRVFDRFFTFRPSEQRAQQHTGLGLVIAKTIVQAYGGSVTAANRDDASGAVFEVKLPVRP